jgi:prepilin-type processing-associated H-X9-DG protein
MGAKVWVCPTAARYGRRQAAGDDPYFVSSSELTRSWGFPDITYRWNANPTRDGDGLNGNLGMRAHPQSAKCLNSPSKAALMWDIPDNLPLFGMSLHNATVDKVNTLFVDGHVDYVKVIPGAWPMETLWWYVAYGDDQGWSGVLTRGNDPNS